MAKTIKDNAKKNKSTPLTHNPICLTKDWRNEKNYDYMDNHTPELWAWEFLRRNPYYRKDWEDTLLEVRQRKFYLSKTKNYHPQTLAFKNARDKWGLLLPVIINPDIDKPETEYPYSLFFTGHYFYEKDDLVMLPEIKDSEVIIIFDFAKPIQQQLEFYKKILEYEQKHKIAYSTLSVQCAKNSPQYWKDHLRRFDAVESGAKYKEIMSVMFKNDVSYDSVQKKVKNSHKEVKNKFANKGYLNILLPSSKMKKRY